MMCRIARASFWFLSDKKSERNCSSCVNLFSETSLVQQIIMADDEACVNCLIYGWTPSEAKITLRCSRCKLFYYCSKECQVERYTLLDSSMTKLLVTSAYLRLQLGKMCEST